MCRSFISSVLRCLLNNRFLLETLNLLIFLHLFYRLVLIYVKVLQNLLFSDRSIGWGRSQGSGVGGSNLYTLRLNPCPLLRLYTNLQDYHVLVKENDITRHGSVFHKYSPHFKRSGTRNFVLDSL